MDAGRPGIAHSDATLTNIWIQPIDGRPAHALTHFTEQTIFAFDGRPTASGSRCGGVSGSDIVLLRGHRGYKQ